MKLIWEITFENSSDDEESDASNESASDMKPDSGEEKEQQDSQESDSSESYDDSPATSNHPYPTPPPDDDGNISLGNGVHKVVLPTPRSQVESKPAKTNMAAASGSKIKEKAKNPNPSILSAALAAIKALQSRSGSSVPAIVKYMKSNGHQVSDERRMGKNVHKALKVAVAKGHVELVKRSFKLTAEGKHESKAFEKMKMQQKRKLAKAKADKEKEKTKMAAEKAKENSATKQKTKEKATKEITTQKARKGMDKSQPEQEKIKPNPSSRERKPKEPKKQKAADEVTPSVAPKKKAVVAVSETPSTSARQKPVKRGKVATESVGAASKAATKKSAKTPRKSIGTLAQPKVKTKLTQKALKQVVSARQQTNE